jgi:hypothetical protein
MAEIVGLRPPASDEARVLLMAIAGQESAWKHRRQVPVAHARSFWQFERGGGVAGVLSHPGSSGHVRAICEALEIPAHPRDIHEAMAWNDRLAVAMARLLLWTDPQPLPKIGDVDGAWGCYLRNWRPGKQRPKTWPDNYARAMAAVFPARSI